MAVSLWAVSLQSLWTDHVLIVGYSLMGFSASVLMAAVGALIKIRHFTYTYTCTSTSTSTSSFRRAAPSGQELEAQEASARPVGGVKGEATGCWAAAVGSQTSGCVDCEEDGTDPCQPLLRTDEGQCSR